jgi:hypothetical protein
MSKFSKRSGELSPIPLRLARKKVSTIVSELRTRQMVESELYVKAKRWLDVESKSHWVPMNQGDDVTELVRQIGISAAEIVWEYNTIR